MRAVGSLISPTASDPPVTPDAPHARQWLIDELAKQEYQAAKPTWFDLASQAVKDWLSSLTVPSAGGLSPLLIVILVLGIAAVVVIAFLVFGLPRLNRRSSAAGEVFGASDIRSAASLRAAAEAAARAGDWTLAVEEIFRAIARGLAERTILVVTPGTTAHEVGARSATVFPAHAGLLREAATTFDRVRYLGARARPEDYGAMMELERTLRSARPGTLPAVGDDAVGVHDEAAQPR